MSSSGVGQSRTVSPARRTAGSATPLSCCEPSPGKIHNLEFKIVEHLYGEVDVLLVAQDIEEVVINGVAQIVLGNLVRPDVHDQVRFDDVDDLLSDRCGLDAGHCIITLGLELTFQDAEEGLSILIAPNALRNFPPPILAGHLAREIHDTVQVFALREPLFAVGPDGLFEQLGEPGPRDVIIQVAAAGVNYPDVLQRQGRYAVPPGASDLPGLEVAGHVAALGTEVTGLSLGDAVCALAPGGGYAEYCRVPVEQCLPVPEGLSMVEAATLPEVFLLFGSTL